MASTQLTARVSVRVQAKNASQTASQKRDTGKNIANALGNGDISDELADQIGNTTNPTIADENGNEWVSMADIIAAGKAMYANGAFEEKLIYEGITDRNGTTWVVPSQYIIPSGTYAEERLNNGYKTRYTAPEHGIGLYFKRSSSSVKERLFASKQQEPYYVLSASSVNENGSYTYYYDESHLSSYQLSYAASYIDSNPYEFYDSNGSVYSSILDYPVWDIGNHDLTWIRANVVATLYGNVRTTGGSLIDWTKTDAEIEEDIRQLHETWDPSEHPGASGSMGGTYILAGPIEYNDADPTQGPPGSVG